MSGLRKAGPGIPDETGCGVVTDEGKRKLAAILSADVAGYSRLMADDERATVRTLTEPLVFKGDDFAQTGVKAAI